MTSDHNKPRNRALIAVALLSLICFIGILCSRKFLETTNIAVNAWIPIIQTQTLTPIAQAINILDTNVLLVITLPSAGYLFIRKETKYGFMLLCVMGANALILQALKMGVASARPLNALIFEGDYSFPSGHLTSVLVLLGMLTYIAYKTNKPAFKVLAVATPVLGVLMALDRLYLNVHWLTDVLAAPFLALFIITATILVVESLADLRKKKSAAIPKEAGEK
jgi:membrane-associated phospholipid phosphatase